MRIVIATLLLTLATPAWAGNISCAQWGRLTGEQQVYHIHGVIEEHLNSNKSKSFSSEHNNRMRRCLEALVYRIMDDYGDACDKGVSREGLDDVFDTYLLSCVQ